MQRRAIAPSTRSLALTAGGRVLLSFFIVLSSLFLPLSSLLCVSLSLPFFVGKV